MFLDLFLQAHEQPPTRIVLDLDATDIPLHGHQAGRFFHGYDDNYCYLPLYIFCGDHLLCAKLRPSNLALSFEGIDASAGALKEVQRLVATLREKWPHVEITIRGGGRDQGGSVLGFCREPIMVGPSLLGRLV